MIPQTTVLEANRHEVLMTADGKRIEMQRWTRGILRAVAYCSASDVAYNLMPWSHWQVVVHRSVWHLGDELSSAGLRAERLAGVQEIQP